MLRLILSRLAVGRLDLKTSDGVRRLWLEAGHVRAVVSDHEDEKLGRWLVQRRLLDASPMAISLLRQPEGVRFGTFLVQQGLVSLDKLERELQALAVAIMSRILFVPASYTLVEGERVQNDAATLNMTTATLLISAVRALEDLKPLEPLLKSDAYLWGAQDAFSKFQRVSLASNEGVLMTRITGELSIADLRRQIALSDRDFLRAIGALVLSGLVVMRERPADKKQPAPKVAAPPAPSTTDPLQFTLTQERERALVGRVKSKIRNQHYYDRLQLSPGATQGQVYVRYRELAEVFHPDRVSEPHLRGLERELAEIFACISEAYDTLGHQDSRAAYDRSQMFGWRPTATMHGAGIPEDHEEVEVIHVDAREQLAAANLRRAKELIALGNNTMAIELLDEVVKVKPEPATLLQLARLEMKNPMWVQRAIDRLKHAVSINPRYTEAWLDLAELCRARKDVASQRQCLEKVLSYEPSNKEAQASLRSIK